MAARTTQVELEQGTQPNYIKVVGTSDEYQQGLIRSMKIELRSLKSAEGYASDLDEGMQYVQYTQAAGTLARDSLKIIGLDVQATKQLRVVLKPLSERDSTLFWHIAIGFSPADNEIATKDEWWSEIYLPADAYDKILAADAEGSVRVIVDARTDAWARTFDFHAYPADPVRWYLKPGKYSTDIVKGRVENLLWIREEDKSSSIDDPIRTETTGGSADPLLQEDSKRSPDILSAVHQLRGELRAIRWVGVAICAGVLLRVAFH